MAKIRKELVEQMFKNKVQYMKDHPELIEEYKNLSANEILARLCKSIADGLPKITTSFKETEIVYLGDKKYGVKK